MNRSSCTTSLLFALVVLEGLCFASAGQAASLDFKALVYFVTGLLIGIFLLLNPPAAQKRIFKSASLWIPVLLITLSLFVVEYFREILLQVPLDYRIADMLPVIQIMNERLLSGIHPYEPIPQIWDNMQPIYLPAMYLVFLPASLFNFDPRWVSVVSLLISFGFLFTLARAPAVRSWWVLIPLVIFILGLTILDTRTLSMSQESVVLLYYSMLSWSIFQKKPLLTGIACGLCLMSRYALAPWIIVLLVICLRKSSRTFVTRMSAALVITVLTLMTIGRAWSHVHLFLSLQGHYLESVMADPGKYVPVISSSLGMARFIDFSNLPMLHSMFLMTALGVPFILLAVYFKFRVQNDWSVFLLASLKLCLVLFVNLLILPYAYLFIVSTFLSLMLLMIHLNEGHTVP